jgi:hypothetical protein
MRRILNHSEYDEIEVRAICRTDLQVSHPVLDLGLPIRLLILSPSYY